jgi:hypothetical protein
MTKAMGWVAAFGVMVVTGCAAEDGVGDGAAPREARSVTARFDALPRLDADGNFLAENLIHLDGPYGKLRSTLYCEPGSWIGGFALLVEPHVGSDWDDTEMNGVAMYCYDTSGNWVETITRTAEGLETFSEWSPKVKKCKGAGNYVNAAQLIVEWAQGDGDDTGANDLQLACAGGGVLEQTNGGPFGEPSGWDACPSGSRACGVAIVSEKHLGTSGDDTGMNGIELRCCRWAAP